MVAYVNRIDVLVISNSTGDYLLNWRGNDTAIEVRIVDSAVLNNRLAVQRPITVTCFSKLIDTRVYSSVVESLACPSIS